MPKRPSILLTTALTLTTLFPGCGSDNNTQPTTRASDAALRDPFGKWSTMDDTDMNVSGGTTGELRKDALKRDIDRTLLLK